MSLPQPPTELAELSRQLCTKIIQEIENSGPMPFDRYMSMALYEPGLGYYFNGLHKFGQTGDFVTAPEQGVLFARSLARQLEEVASELGEHWTVLELGAGSGVLARDLLRSLESLPARYFILEASAPLRAVQQETLAGLPASVRERVEWIRHPPEQGFNGVIVANEVVDALPVARFRSTTHGIEEQCVGVEEGRLAWQCGEPRARVRQAVERVQAMLPAPLPEGYTSEICLDLPGWIETVTASLERGLALFVDYGYPRGEYYHPERSEGTLVCHYRHRAHFDPFVWPGLNDLSAFVDFTALAEAGVDCGLEVAGFTSQAGFLLGLGIADEIAAVEDERERLEMTGEIKRLTLPGEMGEKFKVLGLTRDFPSPLSGLEMINQLHRL